MTQIHVFNVLSNLKMFMYKDNNDNNVYMTRSMSRPLKN